MGIKRPRPSALYCTYGLRFGGVALKDLQHIEDNFVDMFLTPKTVVIGMNRPQGLKEVTEAKRQLDVAERFCKGHVEWSENYEWGKYRGKERK